MADIALASVLLAVVTFCPGTAFRTDTSSGVISFNNVFLLPIPIGSTVEPEDPHFRLSLQKYYSLVWECTVLMTVYDKALEMWVDDAKLPCGVEDTVTTEVEGGLLQLGELVYSKGRGVLVLMMVGGGCVVRNYVRDEDGELELRSSTRPEHVCRAMLFKENQ